MKIIVLMILLVAILSSTTCGTKLNKTWYPLGPGKDTVCIVGDGKFSLGKTVEGIDLTMHTNEYNAHSDVLLAFVNSYKKKNNKLYVYSDEGYCVVDIKSNTAKVLITVEKQYFSNLVGENEAVTYLSSYDDFSAEDKKVFEKLAKKNSQNAKK